MEDWTGPRSGESRIFEQDLLERLGDTKPWVHGVHHAYPDDRRRLTTPVVMTLLMGAIILAVFLVVLGRPGFPCFAGFIHGYLLYDLVHYAIHRGSLGTPIGRYLRRYHLQHHFGAAHRQFGVTSPLWDFIFRTSR